MSFQDRMRSPCRSNHMRHIGKQLSVFRSKRCFVASTGNCATSHLLPQAIASCRGVSSGFRLTMQSRSCESATPRSWTMVLWQTGNLTQSERRQVTIAIVSNDYTTPSNKETFLLSFVVWSVVPCCTSINVNHSHATCCCPLF